MGQSIAATAQVTREMKLPAVFFVLHQSVVTAAPQTNVGTFSAFSNFNPQSQIFTAGSNSQLSQTFSSSQDYGFQSLDYGLDTLLGSQGLGGAGFNGLANTGLDINTGAFDVFSSVAGGCDSFCQSAKVLEEQSLNQFQTDLKIFESQFANSQSNANINPQNNVAGSPVFGQDVNNKRPTSFNQIRPITPRPQPVPVTPVSQPTFTKPKVRPFNILKRPATTSTTPSQPSTTEKQTTRLRTTLSTTTPIRTTNVPITIPPKKEENKNSNGVSIPVETTTRKSTKIRFTFNGKTIGGSKSTTKRSVGNVGDFPISTFFNEEEEEEEEGGNIGSNFPVFAAVPN